VRKNATSGRICRGSLRGKRTRASTDYGGKKKKTLNKGGARESDEEDCLNIAGRSRDNLVRKSLQWKTPAAPKSDLGKKDWAGGDYIEESPSREIAGGKPSGLNDYYYSGEVPRGEFLDRGVGKKRKLREIFWSEKM